MSPVIEGLTAGRTEIDGMEIAYETGGSGPALLLLHGYPQHRLMWRLVAPALAETFTVVASDLRGYGESAKPPGDPAHERYSKRAMAADQVALMRLLGHERFAVCGHDRGGRVAHRMCLDHPAAVAAAAALDIVPTRRLFETADSALAGAYYHWFFLSQPPELPERLIGGASRYFVETTLDRWSAPGFAFPPEIVDAYADAFTPDAIHASCEDYRAAATVDLDHDVSDAGRSVTCPLMVAWGTRGAMHRLYDVPATWRDVARDVRPAPIDCGHFPAEEAPDATLQALRQFLAGVDPW